MARKKIQRISCGCEFVDKHRYSKSIQVSAVDDPPVVARDCECNIDTPKGKHIQVSEADVKWIVLGKNS